MEYQVTVNYAILVNSFSHNFKFRVESNTGPLLRYFSLNQLSFSIELITVATNTMSRPSSSSKESSSSPEKY